jgi:uncharacterized protein (DUF3820 family)
MITTKSQRAKTWNNQLKINEYTQRRLTFGKHVGIMIRDLPLDYIKWGILNLGPNNDWAEMFARELQRRDNNFRKPLDK